MVPTRPFTMNYRLATGLLVLCLITTPAHANSVVLETTITINSGQRWQAVLAVDKGELTFSISTTQGVLNFSLVQTNNSIYFTSISPSTTAMNTIAVEQGQLGLDLLMTQTFFEASVSLLLTQTSTNQDELLIGAGVLILLLLPFVYLIGKNRG